MAHLQKIVSPLGRMLVSLVVDVLLHVQRRRELDAVDAHWVR